MHSSISTEHTLFVCALCRPNHEAGSESPSAGQQLIEKLQQELQAVEGCDRIRLQPVRCMAACERGCTAALATPNKLTFILHDLSPAKSAPELAEFCRQYLACPDGKVPYHERSTAIKQSTSFILPPVAAPPVAAV
ncbi:MAG TPA: DUF1636 domain-containing protein [Leptolyngbyaceae cyanobacterium]